jgi:hypothetical protein
LVNWNIIFKVNNMEFEYDFTDRVS